LNSAYKSEIKANINSLIDRLKSNFKTVFIFGHCKMTEEIINYLFTYKINVLAILDNNNSKQGLAYEGIPIKHPSAVKDVDNSCSIVLIANRFYSQMVEQLRRLGYKGEIGKLIDYNSFAEYSLSENVFNKMTERVKRGMVKLNDIRCRYPIEHLVICPNNALGDVYWAMSFLPAYRKKRGIANYAVVTVNGGCLEVVEMFGVTSIISLNRSEMDELVQALIFTHEDNHILAHHDIPYTDNIIKYLNAHFLSFIDYYRYAVYGLSADARAVPPALSYEFSDNERLVKGKTVILSPYAKSVVELPESFWESLVEKYKKEGYLVCTNIAGDELPVKGTEELRLSLSQIIAAVEYAGTFIGIRNGLCDVLYTAKCHKIVVFPDCVYSTTPHKVEEFFDLPGWEKIIYKIKDENEGCL